jgi:glycogen debranching enzyme
MSRLFLTVLLLSLAPALFSQVAAPVFTPVPPIAFDTSDPVIRAHTEAGKPFTVAGERGVILGLQDGTLETWLLPMKLLSHLTIEADVENYTVPIDVNQQSAEIEVRPDRTVITYSHIAFTVRQIMFSPSGTPAGTGPVVLFQFDCLHPTDFTFRFTPELRWMWPERNEGTPGVEWVAPGHNPHEVPGGFYVLHSDYPDFAAAVTIPGALPGILAPYQERPKFYPAELKLHIDPARERGKLYPLLMAYGATVAEANTGRLGATLEKLNEAIPALYQAQDEMWKKTLASSVSIATPDKALNEAFQWAVVSIEQLKAKTIPGQSAPIGEGAGGAGPGAAGSTKPNPASNSSTSSAGADETALVAGYYDSGDSARPGFGWFFGRDALYAVDGYGDFSLSRSELEFLIHRQRADGKIMHEWSQTAAAIDWRQFSYMYAAADSTPLFLLAALDYVRHSGDGAFLKAHRDAIEKAWKFETDPAHDSDHDGIYDNSQGTGWVESWPGGLPHQEIYLALLDQQASEAYAQIEHLLGDEGASTAAAARARAIGATIEREYYDPEKGCYAFATNPAGTPNGPVDNATTVYPALAWWSGKSSLAHGDQCLRQFAAATLNTDWGLRDLSNEDKYYDGMSYHQGSVWPLFTGWAALAEYRGGQPLAGYQMLMENANLTWAQDLGAVTELLSGDFYVPFGRSTSHQLWSSAMVVTPVLRGLFGIDVDAQTKTITVNPHLPAGWDHAEVRNFPLAGEHSTIHFNRQGNKWLVHMAPDQWHLRSDLTGSVSGQFAKVMESAKKTLPGQLSIPIPPIEITQDISAFSPHLAEDNPSPDHPPIPGARTSRFRIVDSSYSDHRLLITCEGIAGSHAWAELIRHEAIVPKVQKDGTDAKPNAVISPKDDMPLENWKEPLLLTIDFPPGEGWKTITVTLTW